MARVVIISRRPEPQAEAKKAIESAYPSTKVITYSASVMDYARMAEIVKEVGPIDVLVLNAMGAHPPTPANDIPLSDMELSFDMNVLAPLQLIKLFVAAPNPVSGTKTVLNVSSGSAQFPFPGQADYGSSKAAMLQFCTHLARELEPVRVLSFHPGAIYTPEASKYFPKDAIQWEDGR